MKRNEEKKRSRLGAPAEDSSNDEASVDGKDEPGSSSSPQHSASQHSYKDQLVDVKLDMSAKARPCEQKTLKSEPQAEESNEDLKESVGDNLELYRRMKEIENRLKPKIKDECMPKSCNGNDIIDKVKAVGSFNSKDEKIFSSLKGNDSTIGTSKSSERHDSRCHHADDERHTKKSRHSPSGSFAKDTTDTNTSRKYEREDNCKYSNETHRSHTKSYKSKEDREYKRSDKSVNKSEDHHERRPKHRDDRHSSRKDNDCLGKRPVMTAIEAITSK